MANTITDTCQTAPIAIIIRNSERYSSCARKLSRVMRHMIRRPLNEEGFDRFFDGFFDRFLERFSDDMFSLPGRSRGGPRAATAGG